MPHEEEYQVQSQLPLMLDTETYPINSSDTGVTTSPSSIKINRSDLHNLLNDKPESVPLTISPETTVSMIPPDTDLVLATSGEGPQTISRTFNTTQGTRNVAIRYRFITTEIPGGYFGTQYNDYFNISIRSNSGGSISESNSMNGLGLGAFDSAGRTTWRERSLAVNSINSSGTARQERLLTVNPEGDTVQVDLTVANVADGLLDSFLVVAFVEERSLAITAMRLNDIDNSPLSYLSASSHPYFDGNTRIHGTITIEGAADDALESLALEIIQDGQVVTTATLDSNAESTLLQAFGEDQRMSISTSQLLFNLVPQGTCVK